MSEVNSITLVVVVAGVTVLLRFLPFMIFAGKRKTPEFVLYLGNVLPSAIIGMLVVYCLREVTIFAAPYGLPEFIAVCIVVGLHMWKRNTLLSIGSGTVLYMLMVQMI